METFDQFIYRKAKAFGVRIVNLCRYLHSNKGEYILIRQILRSGTSIGANIAESKFAQSTADMISKYSIARKEANETKYWLDLLVETDTIDESSYLSMKADCEEIIKILTSSILSLTKN